MNKKEKEKIKQILEAYNTSTKYTQHHIKYEDITEEIGGHGDYTILVVKIEQEWDNKGAKYYVFVDHKAFVDVFILNDKFQILNKE